MTMALDNGAATATSRGAGGDDEKKCLLTPTSMNSCTFLQVRNKKVKSFSQFCYLISPFIKLRFNYYRKCCFYIIQLICGHL